VVLPVARCRRSTSHHQRLRRPARRQCADHGGFCRHTLERQFSHIAGITEMTSSSSLGSTNVTLQFDLSRNIDGAARDVQAAINAARTYLPANLPSNPSYRKVNPADSPIMLLSLTSNKYDVTKLYDLASTILEQKLSQIQGVGQVECKAEPRLGTRRDQSTKLESFGLTLGNVQSVLSLQNSDRPRGQLSNGNLTPTSSQRSDLTGRRIPAADCRYHNGAAVRLEDVADVVNSTQNLRSAGYADGKRLLLSPSSDSPAPTLFRPWTASRRSCHFLRQSFPGITTTIVLDRTTTIRASVNTVYKALIGSVCLVILMVFVFLRSRAPHSSLCCRATSLIGPSPRCICSATRSTTCRLWR